MATETQRGRQGDKGRGRQGEGEKRRGVEQFPAFLVSFPLSPCPPVPLSPRLPLSVVLWLCG